MKGHVLKISLAVGVVFVLGVLVYFFGFRKAESQLVSSFDECVKAGNSVMESYPEKCVSNGKTFVRDIGNELELRNQIRITNPRPNQIVTTPLDITGEAVGNWFWEATFQVSIVDANGKSLGVGYATSTGEWMMEEFVPFSAKVEFSKPGAQTGKLILEKANPSALPENSATLIVPVSFN